MTISPITLVLVNGNTVHLRLGTSLRMRIHVVRTKFSPNSADIVMIDLATCNVATCGIACRLCVLPSV